MAILTTKKIIKSLEDMLLIYGNRHIITITDGENKYRILEIDGYQCAKHFEPSDKVAEIVIKINKVENITEQALANADQDALSKAESEE